ncbi:MAG TPA: deoxyribose-phosphate aldolase [Pirellulaceae bacterium]|nr:deoxyribose-phosphate aldolase [Pirellulaceae bacterium]HMO90938.1 deoxyribose-phosphate aldolase [Pirellulaceae bacterium]HMP69837.1 deoxyribose-phosphate aldolase [Pirellulaceae bacterium]
MTPTQPEKNSIARLIDHALLHPTLTDAEICEGVRLAKELGAASVCVKPYAVKMAAELLAGSQTAVGTVIGFPHGSATSEIKAAEAEQACRDGATELDMVINIGKALQGDWDYVARDIQAVVNVGKTHNALVKVIFETDYVSDAEKKIKLCEISEKAGAAFVKTSTGFGFNKQPNGDYNYVGATLADIRLMRAHCSEHVGVKASGGIRNYEDAIQFKNYGASRLGTSATKVIVEGAGSDDASY